LDAGYTTETAILAPADGGFGDLFGSSVALAEHGDTALIGNPADERFNEEDVGSAYVFERANSGWTQQTKLVPADGDETTRSVRQSHLQVISPSSVLTQTMIPTDQRRVRYTCLSE
jgi:hypothetical protein